MMDAANEVKGVKGLRLLGLVSGTTHKLARIQWATNDASIYVLPYTPPGGIGYAGVMKVPGPGESSVTQLDRQHRGNYPKLTLHESGRCHASVDSGNTSPVWGRGLIDDDADGHIATIISPDVRGLPVENRPSRKSTVPDVALVPAVEGSAAVNVAVFVCLTEEDAKQRGQMQIKMERVGRPRPLFLAIKARIPDLALSEGESVGSGVLAMGGWGPGDDQRPMTGVFAATAEVPDEPRISLSRNDQTGR